MDAFETFDAAAGELMLKQRVKATQLHKRLRKITTDASKDLPPLEILYCASFGGYGYSEEFESFIKAKKTIPDSLATISAMECGPDSDDFGCFVRYSHKDRVRNVQWLAPFGQDIMEKWPGIVQLVQAYMRNDLGNQMDLVQKMVFDKKDLHKMLKIREAIAAEKGKIDGETAPSSDKKRKRRINGETKYCFGLLTGKEDFSVYATSTLKEMLEKCDAKQSKLTPAIEENRDALLVHLTKAQISAMEKSLSTKLAEKVEKLDWRKHEKWRRLSFIDTIAKYGEHHYAVWQKQGTFNQKAMSFLCLNPKHTERLATQGNNVDCAKMVGLCAAGGEHCTLKIAEVPCMAEWQVGAYDGQESVYVV